ncbi:hypothetical protein M902_0699 [Bacteriovorax sp. BAL6_X]|uniref:hypothetical protein n=1 Tax=Bacteriovorax sp. BAL6_X TaxID=1201290 RepID=UPI0003860008|nr:hypothetical protein [Bacteriovorax sp. BAL6_X]EPZ49660.1 hypothetical protein M902_0699 [Bacteriovorax sp. BAL6_X]
MSNYTIKDYQTLIASFVASLIALGYYWQKYKLDKENAKRELFTQLNERYDELNDHLEELLHIEFETQINSQVNNERSLDEVWEYLFEDEPCRIPPYIAATFDYINLCSEQYYWYKKGFIDKQVWSCWHKGMQDWYKYSFFLKKVVKREKERNSSYYNDGFLNLFEG